MGESSTDKIFTLWEKIEGKLFDISLVNDEQKNSVERVFSEVLWNSVVEQSSEDKGQYNVNQDTSGSSYKKNSRLLAKKPIPLSFFSIKWALV